MRVPKRYKELLVEALTIAEREWTAFCDDGGGCQASNESEQRSIDAGVKARHARALRLELRR